MADLDVTRANSASALGALMRDFRPNAPRGVLLEQHDAICRHLLAIGVATLLLEAASQKFLLSLARIAENGRRFLTLFGARRLDPVPASRNLPLLAAVVTGDAQAPLTIARLSRTTRAAGDDEYESEFLWARAFQMLVDPSAGDVAPVLGRLIEAAPETHGALVQVARALGARDAAAFEEAFGQALQVYGDETERRSKAFTTPSSFFAHRFVWVEGLALLALARRAGLEPAADFRYCPRLARVPLTASYEGDWAIATGAPR